MLSSSDSHCAGRVAMCAFKFQLGGPMREYWLPEWKRLSGKVAHMSILYKKNVTHCRGFQDTMIITYLAHLSRCFFCEVNHAKQAVKALHQL